MLAYCIVEFRAEAPASPGRELASSDTAGRCSEFLNSVPESLGIYDGRVIAGGGPVRVLEGDWRPERLVIIEFPSMDNAEAWSTSFGRGMVPGPTWPPFTSEGGGSVLVEGVPLA